MTVDQARVALLSAVTLTELDRVWREIEREMSPVPASIDRDYRNLREELAGEHQARAHG